MNSFAQQFQRYLVYILRHHPYEIGLKLGDDGFVPIPVLEEALQKSRKYASATAALIHEVVANQTDKQRLEICGNMIRCRYGHSQGVVEDINYIPVRPPQFLYHGTSLQNKDSILEKGLLPISRKYVHLSESIEIATKVALRHSSTIVIFIIDCEKALLEGIEFFHPESLIWLTKTMPSKFLKLLEKE